MSRPGRAAGFTLIELMIVVAIIGLLSSVAIPEFTRLTLRTKQAERAHVMQTVKNGVMDLYLQFGDLPPDPGAGGPLPILVGDWNPPLPASTTKRMPNWSLTDWPYIFQRGGGSAISGAPDIEGALYYSYYYTILRGPPATLLVYSQGDLDGDGAVSHRQARYTRESSGLFRLTWDFPSGTIEQGVDDGNF